MFFKRIVFFSSFLLFIFSIEIGIYDVRISSLLKTKLAKGPKKGVAKKINKSEIEGKICYTITFSLSLELSLKNLEIMDKLLIYDLASIVKYWL